MAETLVDRRVAVAVKKQRFNVRFVIDTSECDCEITTESLASAIFRGLDEYLGYISKWDIPVYHIEEVQEILEDEIPGE